MDSVGPGRCGTIGQPQFLDVRQTANFEASGRSSSESTGQWQTWGSGSETKAPYNDRSAAQPQCNAPKI